MLIYLDNHSTTPCDPCVLDAMLPYFTEHYGNPSAPHEAGIEAREAVEQAREQVASIINAPPETIYFTTGATASNNILLQGLLLKARRLLGTIKPFNVITTSVEHSSVLKCVEEMRYRDEMNHNTILLDVDEEGNIDLDKIDRVLCGALDTLVLSVMTANNEIGTIYDVEAIGKLCKEHDVFFHTDATQAIGKVDIDVETMNIDALSLSAHKIYGPKGIGALYMRNAKKILPLINGGLQETITSGTLNVPAIVGFGKACEILKEEQYGEREHCGRLRDLLMEDLLKLDGININGTMKNRLPNNLNLTIKGVKAEAIVAGMDDVILSSGASCSSGNFKPSHVIEALGKKDEGYTIRMGLSKYNTKEDIGHAVSRITEVVNEIRNAGNI